MYDIVKNPIPKSGLFTTPTLAEIQDFISKLPAGQQANANLVFMFTLNSCNQLVEDNILSKEIFAQ
jgi:hypothetical protein